MDVLYKCLHFPFCWDRTNIDEVNGGKRKKAMQVCTRKAVINQCVCCVARRFELCATQYSRCIVQHERVNGQ